MADSGQKKVGRVRPARVHIEYEVNLGDAQVMKELPFVVGVLADLSGQPAEALPKLKDREAVTIDRDNFDDVLGSMKPRLALKVDNQLKGDGSKLAVELNFKKLEDFEPENVVKQVEPMAKLLEIRNQLKDLLNRTDGNDRLDELLGAIIKDTELRGKLKETLKAEGPAGDAPAGDGPKQ